MGNWSLVSGTTVTDIDTAYGVRTTAWLGHGIPPVTHNYAEQALLPGALYQSTKVQPRDLVLKFSLQGTSLPDYHHLRDHLVDAFRPTGAPLQLRYTGAGGTVDCYGYYEGGLDGDLSIGNNIEQLAARFRCYDPFFYAPTAGTVALDGNAAIADADCLVQLNSGVWANVVSAFAAGQYVYALAIDSSNNLFVGGSFTNIGDADGDNIIQVTSGGSVSSLDTGANSGVLALAVGPDDTVYAAGMFTVAGGVADTTRIAYWDGSNWNAMGTGADAQVQTLAVGQDGAIYAGGLFTSMSGVANTAYIAKWDGSSWSALGTGMNARVYSLSVAPNGDLYAAGDFTTAGGIAANYVAKWNGSSWSALGSGLSGGILHGYAIKVMVNGDVYVAGTFTTAGGVSASNIAKWNGSGWEALGSGLNAAGYALHEDGSGLLHVGGAFTTAGGIALADRYAIWNRSTWTHANLDLPGTPTVRAFAERNGRRYVGYDTAGTAYSSEETTVTNTGSAPAYPTFTIARTGGTVARVEYLHNETTDQTLYLNYALQSGETLTIDLTPGNKAITSTFYGNVIGRALLPNSDFSTWRLDPGANVVSLYVYETGSPTVTANCIFTPTYWSVDGVAP